ncbi:alanine--tRNA ligase [Pseudobacteriovorax antillogorgiicola]|uniref:Alanine--tRNA ligase n=1 Tax=Pseudobacteriovorax antillogorgiicola TaxID=1513793 RepID=A0A1Y6CKQ6_9BACT|nr:alanine--tRNA ligase [Pseudobacteriovorax antillogorgiicola]TCS45846.1 alanyl-tRNA synthetase [Pseudobacteriovorax antillogorgiicola]SMF71802.1 alanyl-tRNA synthetase [Pseudobacteriovorax antillogorgiicola]
MKVAEIRRKYLNFFASHDHVVVESSPLIPQNDPSLLFANAGMNQFKDTFLGNEARAYTRATSCQKCVRAGGKHNDLENVGFTARHHTFFEMLGNFSFGDYFKEDAISMAWEFVTKHLNLPIDKIYVTVFETDDEAADIWINKVGFPKERIYRFGEKDNFWSMGDVGPCGPCSEMFIDRGEQYACGEECGLGVCECDRYMEFWNLVFMQYNRDKDGNLTPLPKPSVDTGMGLERIASIIQKTDTNYEIDAFIDILNRTAKMAGQSYDPKAKDAFNYRVVGDHGRATTFLIADGVMPSNEGRGYVLRRIIRRAVRYGKNIGFQEPFLHKICEFVIEQMKDAYPDLTDKKSFIMKAVQAEEEQFFKTLERGLNLLDEEIGSLKGKTLSGEVAFKLYDTFGFPVDLTRIICQERGLGVDETGFEQAMAKQKEQSRQNWKGAGGAAVDGIYHELAEVLRGKNQAPVFQGYDQLSADGTCVALLKADGDSKASVDFFSQAGELIEAVFDKTPFYAEGGGQVGDRGVVKGDGFEADVVDVRKPVDGLIVAQLKVTDGSIKVGGKYHQQTDEETRRLTERNHTATHMLHWALRDTLGDHVKQAGSLVNDELLRFDFSHFQSLTNEEIKTIEDKINQRIWSNSPVIHQEMGRDEAVEAGAIAFFGEKYGDVVRVVRVGDFSTELCGGCHVRSTSEINIFKIVAESSIAAGVRRIVAYTSKQAFNYLSAQDHDARLVKDRFKVSSAEEVLGRVEKLVLAEKDLRRQLDELKSQSIANELDALVGQAESVGDCKVLTYLVPEDDQGVKTLRDVSDRVRQKDDSLIVVLGMKQASTGKALLLAAKGKAVAKGFKSGDLIKVLAPHIDGRGGGKPDMAQAGGTKLEGIDKALQEASSEIKKLLS